jgi:NHLM bacteriocin system ABC transporter peptidase/ATP-binding protein
MEIVECGAAALAIVLGYYGKFVSLEQLRVACGVSRDGTKANNILRAARGYGLKAKGFSKQPEELGNLPLPLVVFWNFNHFLVVEGFAGDRVHVNDPALGPHTVSAREFEESFTGVALVFEPGPEFAAGGARPTLWSSLGKRLRGSESGVLYVVLASLAVALTGLVIPVFAKIFVDYVLVANIRGWVLPLLIGMAVAGLLGAVVTWLQRHYLLRLSTKLAVVSSHQFLRHLLALPIEFYAQRYAGEVGSRMEINDRIAKLLSGQLSVNLLNMVMALLYVVLMLFFDVPLTLLGLAITALNVVALRQVARRRRDTNARLLQEQGKMMGTAMAGLQAIESLKASGAEADFFARWSGHLAKVIATAQKMHVSSLALFAVPAFLSTLTIVLILGAGALRVMDGSMTVGGLVAFQALLLSFMTPVQQLVMLGGSLQEVEGEMGRMDDVLRHPVDPHLNRPATPEDVQGNHLPARLSGGLEMEGICYGYSRLDPPLIDGLSLTLKPGSRVALVGPSASGKSTVAKILSGLYRPWAGELRLDGVPWERLPRRVIANTLAMVDQDFFLCAGTVREVLTLWNSAVAEEDLILAAKDACIHEEIAARAGGYDSLVEEEGRNFSSGQRQRLEIARALVGNPAILVLDEATSALDAVTEKQIDDNLRRRGCTCVIVAHRLSTIRDCDEIIVLDHGVPVARGSHEELYAAGGLYRELVSA